MTTQQDSLMLSEDELQSLTGYKQHSRQRQWLIDRLKIVPPLRADGLPVVSRAQVEAGLAGKGTQPATRGPNWSKVAA